MGINELWMPSPHYSASRGPCNVAAFHTTQGAMDIRSLGGWFQNPSAQCSSHHGADNVNANLLGAYVYENHKAWTQASANPWCISLEMCAYAEWSTEKWMSQNTLLNNAADWLRYVCGKYGIPYVLLNDSQAQSGNVKGICQHINFGSMGSGHVDCGKSFPINEVIKRAKAGGSSPAPSERKITVAGSVRDGSGRLWSVGSWDGNGQLNFKVGNGVFSAIDDTQSGAIGGPTISYDRDNDCMDVTFINGSKKMCLYRTAVSPIDWNWSEIGGKFQG